MTTWPGPSTQGQYSPLGGLGCISPQLATTSPGLLHHPWQFPCTHNSVNSPLCINSPLITLIWLSHLLGLCITQWLHTLTVQRSSHIMTCFMLWVLSLVFFAICCFSDYQWCLLFFICLLGILNFLFLKITYALCPFLYKILDFLKISLNDLQIYLVIWMKGINMYLT